MASKKKTDALPPAPPADDVGANVFHSMLGFNLQQQMQVAQSAEKGRRHSLEAHARAQARGRAPEQLRPLLYPVAAKLSETHKSVAAPVSVVTPPAERVESSLPVMRPLDRRLELFRRKEGRDPQWDLRKDRVWEIDGNGSWMAQPTTWAADHYALQAGTHPDTIYVGGLNSYISRQLPPVSQEYLNKLLDQHTRQEGVPLQVNADSLNRQVWMETRDGYPYKSAVRWNYFNRFLQTSMGMDMFAGQSLNTLAQLRWQQTGGRPPAGDIKPSL